MVAEISKANVIADLTAAAYVHAQSLVAIDHARRLNIFCVGEGSPTVLLEAGSGGSTVDWRHVQGRIAMTTRVCSYDRAGYGFSDPATRVSDVRNAVDDLHRLIQAAHVGRNTVLVGHSNGGLYVVSYAERYPQDVGGLVLVDPGYPGQQNYAAYGLDPLKAAALRTWAKGLVSTQARCVALARDGKITSAAGKRMGCSDTPPGLDISIRTALRRIYAAVAYQAANLSEFQTGPLLGRLESRARSYCDSIDRFQERGGARVWTLHPERSPGGRDSVDCGGGKCRSHEKHSSASERLDRSKPWLHAARARFKSS